MKTSEKWCLKMSRKNRNQRSKEPQKEAQNISISVENITVEKPITPYRTVGTVRRSKNGKAISIKLFPENRYLHLSIQDVERILDDENNQTVGNVREYIRNENSEVVNNGK